MSISVKTNIVRAPRGHTGRPLDRWHAGRPLDRRLAALEQVFKALADRTRLRILALLLGGEVCVCHVYESLKIPQPKASRHLAYLKRAGLVEDRKVRLWVYYRLADPGDEVVRTVLASIVHGLTHVPLTQVDWRRLERATGRPIAVPDTTAVVPACCQKG